MNPTLKFMRRSAAVLMLATAIVLPSYAQQGGATATRRTTGRGGAGVDPTRSELEREMMTRELEEGSTRRPAERKNP